MVELTFLQAMRLKGRLTAEMAAVCSAVPLPEARARLDSLVAEGLATSAGAAVRISPAGRKRLTALLDRERASVNQDLLEPVYENFNELNTELKSVITAWQLRDPQTPNDHSDASYDAGVINRLHALHERFTPLLDRLVTAAPRLAPYRSRFQDAIDKALAKDYTYVARPITDSYHTIWFELHEDLIGLLGRTRAEEAAAGRAL